jgi:hypothetical protein
MKVVYEGSDAGRVREQAMGARQSTYRARDGEAASTVDRGVSATL